MKNIIIIFLLFLTNSLSFAQIGINTAEPKATLDINAKTANGNSGLPEGILIPRVDRERAKSMLGIQTSTMIYVDDINTGSQDGKAINIDKEGYYNFNGTSWVKFDYDNNIYNTAASLENNRLVMLDGKNIAFKGTASNAFSVNEKTFSVDAANHRVGLGTEIPAQTLDVEGTVRLSQSVTGNVPTWLYYARPMYADKDNGQLKIPPRGASSVIGGFRPGQNFNIITLPKNNTIVRVRFICHIDASSNANNEYSQPYTYGEFTIIGTGDSNPIKFIDVNIKDAYGNAKPLSSNTGTNITWSNYNQGNTSLRLNQTSGVFSISNTHQVMSYFFEILGGT